MGKRLDVSCAVTLSYSERGLLGRPKHRAGHKPQARMMARQVRPRLPDGRPRQGEGQAGLLPVLLREKEAREADKARLALGPSARKEQGGGSAPPAYRRDFANIGLGGYAWRLWGPHRLKTPAGYVQNRCARSA